MAECPKYKIDSNDTGLRFAVEECLKQLPATGVVWKAQEPDSYGDFGSTTTTVARNPINPTRQRKKGVVTDKDAVASYTTDLTNNNHQELLQGFMFAAARHKATTVPVGLPAVPVTAVSATTGYAMATVTAATFATGMLVLASGFSNEANNGLKVVGVNTAGNVMVAGLVAEASPPAGASVQCVGREGGAFNITVSGSVVKMTGTALNTYGVIPGEWVVIGGDDVNSSFVNNKGFARVDAISATEWTFGKTSWTPQAETGTGKTIRVFTGVVIRNEDDPNLIKRYSYQFERTLGNDADGVMGQYVEGAVSNEFTLTVENADKVTMELGYVGCDSVARSGLQGLKAGTRPPLISADAINSSSNVKRLAFGIHGDVKPLFAFATDMELTIANNASGAKAIGTLGNFDVNVGTFDVGGSVTAYFQDVRALNAVNDNADVTMDLIMASNNTAMAFDIPLLALGNGMLAVEKDQAITVPLDNVAGESVFGHTLLYVFFPYIPSYI